MKAYGYSLVFRVTAACTLLAVVGCSSLSTPSWMPFSSHRVSNPLSAVETEMNPRQRRQALRQLASSGPRKPEAEQEQVVGQLVRLLPTESNAHLRAEICRTLAAYPQPAAREAILAGLKDNDPNVRRACVDALAQRKDPEAVPLLGKVLNEDSHTGVRIAAARNLGEFGAAATGQLAGALSDRDPALQRRVMESLAVTTGQDFGNDVVAWRTFLDGGTPQPQSESIATQVKNFFYRL